MPDYSAMYLAGNMSVSAHIGVLVGSFPLLSTETSYGLTYGDTATVLFMLQVQHIKFK